MQKALLPGGRLIRMSGVLCAQNELLYHIFRVENPVKINVL